MRKAKLRGLFALSLLCAFSFCMAAVRAEEASGTRVALPEPGSILQWATRYEWVPEGLKAVKGADSNGGGAGFVRQFDVSGDKTMSFTFRLPVYSLTETEGETSALLEGRQDHEVDVVFTNKNNGKALRFRLWVNSASGVSAADTAVAVLDEADNWKSYETDSRISGTAREDSAFTVGYRGGRLLMVKAGQRELAEVAGKDADTTAALNAMLDGKFSGCETLQIHITQPAIAEGKESVMIFTDISGQSLANDGSTLTDDVPPEVPAVRLAKEGQLVAGKNCSLFSMNWWGEDTKGAQFVVAPVFDAIAGNALARKLTATKDGRSVELFSYGDEAEFYPDAFSFPEAGEWTLRLFATDPAGNTGVSAETVVTVLDRIVITVAEGSRQGEMGKPYAVPAATASFGGQSYDVAIGVTDPAGNPVTVDGGAFTPAQEGRYRITYTASVTGDPENRDEVVREITVFDPASPKVQPEPGNIVQWAGSSRFVEEGLEAVTDQWGGPGLRMFFDVSGGKDFTLKFKVPVYDGRGGWLDETYKQPIVDVFVKDAVGGNMAVLRLYGDAYDEQTGSVKVRITLGDRHDVEQDGIDPDVFFPAGAYGRMDENHEFTVTFNTEDFFQYVQSKDGAPERAAFAGQETAHSYAERMSDFFQGTTSIQVWLRLSTYVEADKQVTKNRVVLTAVNGQSLANVGGLLADTRAPYVAPLERVGGRTVEIGKDYTVEVKGSPSEAVKQKDAVLFAPYVSDVLGNERLTYKLRITGNGTEKLTDGLSFRLDAAGTYTIALIATDEMGLTGQAEITVTAVKGYDIQLSGAFPASGKAGERLTLPAATASDSESVARTVTITVEDMNGRKVELDADNAFVPERAGVYYVTYSSQYTDGNGQMHSTKLEKEIVVTGDAPAPSAKPGLGAGAIAGIVCGCVGGAALLALAVIWIVRRKKK